MYICTIYMIIIIVYVFEKSKNFCLDKMIFLRFFLFFLFKDIHRSCIFLLPRAHDHISTVEPSLRRISTVLFHFKSY